MWHIVSDSCCDLYSLEGGEGIVDFVTIPFSIRIGDREYLDDEGIDTVPDGLHGNFDAFHVELDGIIAALGITRNLYILTGLVAADNH